eukprot:Hpha_TRINITY_DN14941_c2_g3::TRINITY_DN14941_c2_g3_i2::g.143514::m.143514
MLGGTRQPSTQPGVLRCQVISARGLALSPQTRLSASVQVGCTTAPVQPQVVSADGASSEVGHVEFNEAVELPLPSVSASVGALTVRVSLTEQPPAAAPEHPDLWCCQASFEALPERGGGREWLTLVRQPAGEEAEGEVQVQWTFVGMSPSFAAQDKHVVGRGWLPPGAPPRTSSAPVMVTAHPPGASGKGEVVKARVHFGDLWAQSSQVQRRGRKSSRSPTVLPDGSAPPRDDSSERLPGPGTLRLRVKGVRIGSVPSGIKLQGLTLACAYAGMERQSQSVVSAEGLLSQGQEVPLELEFEFDVVYSTHCRKFLSLSLWGQTVRTGDRGGNSVPLGDGVLEVAQPPPASIQMCELSAGHMVSLAYRVTYQRPLQEGARGRPKSAHPSAKKTPRCPPASISRRMPESDASPQRKRPQSAQALYRPLSAGKAERLRREVAGVHQLLSGPPLRRDEGDDRPRPAEREGIDTGGIQMDFESAWQQAVAEDDELVLEEDEEVQRVGRNKQAALGSPPDCPDLEAAGAGAPAGGGPMCFEAGGPPPLLPPGQENEGDREGSPEPCSPPPLVARSVAASSPPQPRQVAAGAPVYAMFAQMRRDIQRQLSLMEERLTQRIDVMAARVSRLETVVGEESQGTLRRRHDSAGLPTTSSPPRSRPASCQSRRTCSSRPWSGGSATSGAPPSLRAGSPIHGAISRPSSSGTSTGDAGPPGLTDVMMVGDEQLRRKFEELAGPGEGWISKEALRRFYRSFDSLGVHETDEQVSQLLSRYAKADQVSFNEFAHLALALAKR